MTPSFEEYHHLGSLPSNVPGRKPASQILAEIDAVRTEMDNYRPVGGKGVSTNLEKEKLIHTNAYKV